MITRFYVDNYKCLVNFEYKPSSMELILGGNGSGKTTVFEALSRLCDFVLNKKKTEEVFPFKDLTRWQSRETMHFELDIRQDENTYHYELILDTNGVFDSVEVEKLFINGNLVIDSVSTNEVEENAEGGQAINSFMKVKVHSGKNIREFRVADEEKSALGHYVAQGFKSSLSEIIFVKINPFSILDSVEASERRPVRSFTNFPAYYFHLLQERQDLVFDLIPILRDNIEGFRSFVLEARGPKARQLRVEFVVVGGSKGQTIRYDFTELSDGQRALIALYTLAFCESGSTLLIDEPENFISSRELQPWLMLLRERIEDFGGQAILISHHPEFINVLAPQDAIQFRRKDGGPVMIRPFETAPYQGLTPAEIVARGWENE